MIARVEGGEGFLLRGREGKMEKHYKEPSVFSHVSQAYMLAHVCVSFVVPAVFFYTERKKGRYVW